jgi:glycosyltransferase involved in cell wall biosynthesis
MKTISVCIATYNGEKYIYDQLQSILIQLSENDEVIISDNYSSDKTIKIIESIKDSRIKIYFFKNRNLIKNFENTLVHAHGDYIFLADQDDIWLPDKVQIMVGELKSNDLVVSDCIAVNNDLQTIYTSSYHINRCGPGFLKNIYKNSYVGCCMAFNRKLLEASLPFPENIQMHDWWIGLIGELIGKVIFLDNKLIIYRRHDSNASITGTKSTFPLITRVKWRFILIKEIILRYIQIRRRP